ncbi:acyltransferase [Candidimonas sp. SYP-B2681]|uniref:acyltransferase family protein n=1 Tax=Candidimonas sp. SYP-B2681 TaxID=2497686 RepID=UPI000F862885|nr:acyltransferase [Candidimonas sp. SYP-B2681]RTZ45769.1 acyltransferase [Candidimonas sp. SYP-B2681]
MSPSRLPLIDAMKGLGCLAIVFHHLAFYGPMSDVVHTAAPILIDWLFNHARLAVQIFLVLAGYLVAAQIAPQGQIIDIPWSSLLWKRYKRLITPFLFAVAITMLVTALVRPWFEHASLSAAPSLLQLLAHALLLHDLLGMEALSAGVWYVAVDMQLFAATMLLTALATYAPASWRPGFPILIMALVAASLWVINRDTSFDDYAPYFFGAYGLGMLSYWASHSSSRKSLLMSIVLLSAVALWLQYRDSVAVVFAMALLLSLAGQKQSLKGWPCSGSLIWLGRRSYSIFLIHFGVCVAFNAIWHVLFPSGILENTLGILAAAGASIAAGAVLFNYVENKRDVLAHNVATMSLVLIITATMIFEAMAG